eukprot:CAMPEP_0115754098 /NCGR_PEP_ID=MMETSP0272-20121206/96686_1 /TAXON_ID=71861 /ORGANISM="Scrippsiella trochoidea, Strain CCMP3099" /LENGTH=66 /DNA_ID=CAMNT_0003199477 /DNA_START=21 /DNA_END=217 /DNA_ORIENTATION=+
MTQEISVMRALSGQKLCSVHIEPETTMQQLRAEIERSEGIPAHSQRLMIGGREMSRRGDKVAEALA